MNNNEITFKDEYGNLVVIMTDVVQLFKKYQQLLPTTPESAGVLIGERRGRHIVITDISIPGKGDSCSRYQVDRKGEHHQKKVDEAFIKSNKTKHYLGEWHTHPEKYPIPSSLDYNSWSKIDASNGNIVFIIVGQENMWLSTKTKSSFNLFNEVTLE
ncbi:CBASS system CD-NTase/cGAS isopeptidase Cap3 [Shewanella frigidimarina]|uniref:CBASS system CD-NTase/cGAS isopeptidase Cap3 n=1 Tax=Shewanella frigidimarina TaxID=56812 RepID=UPI003D7AC249